jgi:hypothetical protein
MSAEASPLVVRSQSASHPLWLRLRRRSRSPSPC